MPTFRAQLLKPSATICSSAGRRPDIACLTRSSLVRRAHQVLRGLAFHFRNHAQSLLQDTEIFISSLAPVETSACLCTLDCRGKAVIRAAMGTGGYRGARQSGHKQDRSRIPHGGHVHLRWSFRTTSQLMERRRRFWGRVQPVVKSDMLVRCLALDVCLCWQGAQAGRAEAALVISHPNDPRFQMLAESDEGAGVVGAVRIMPGQVALLCSHRVKDSLVQVLWHFSIDFCGFCCSLKLAERTHRRGTFGVS